MLHLSRGNYLTPTAAQRRTPSVRIIETTYTLGQSLPRHSHDHVYMVVMISGVLRETALGRNHDMTRGCFVFNSAGESHHNTVLAPGTRCLNVEFSPACLATLREAALAPRDRVVYARAGAAIGAVGRLYSAVLDPLSDLEIEESLAELLATTAPAGAGPAAHAPRWLPPVIERLCSGSNRERSLDALAAAAGLHRAHLCRAFRAAVGCTMGEYLRRLRADQAHRRLVSDCAPPALAASQCGYADQSHMTRDLARRYARSPARLRSASAD